MQLLEVVKKTEFLGREFLLWLWYQSEAEEGLFDPAGGGKVGLWLEGKITLQSETETGVEVITCEGETSDMKEARFALAEGKAVREATVKLAIGDNRWSFVLDAAWLNLRSFKSPKVMNDSSEDPDGLFYEKAYLIEEALAAMDRTYAAFLERRLSPEWGEDRKAIGQWIRRGRDDL